ncbi:MAG: ABC-ATPase domain-containing protein [Deltaproteobacteria bacterium]|nr:ABC-ATPase domain-containing protein [Deltaproteobacteria bacterium]
MPSKEDLRKILARVDGRGYKAYKDIEGAYDFGDFWMFVDHVQGDPFASPSRVRLQVHQDRAKIPPELFQNKTRAIALQDYLTRKFAEAIRAMAKGSRGIGGSGKISVDIPGQEVLERTSCFVNEKWVEVRFTMGLPAAGRTILSQQAEEMFFGEVPRIVERSLFYGNLPPHGGRNHVDVVEDQEYIRSWLSEKKWICFLANGSLLPRTSGVDDRPLPKEEGMGMSVILFQSPPELEVEVPTLHRGRIRGMAIPEGVVLIAGGGFHGKSTLLNAIEKGVFAHIPADGREFVVTHPAAVRIRAEDGRAVEKVDIRPFITNLPLGKDTTEFSTENASGSTSQAANIMEALEVGAKVLLIDEDTSATNFMIRDQRMQELVSKEKEPITPFIDKVRQLYRDRGVSTVLVMGGSGDYFDVADRVIVMDSYIPKDVTSRVRDIIQKHPTGRKPEGGEGFGKVYSRIPLPESFDPRRGKREVKIGTQGLKKIVYGRTEIDLSQVSQVVNESQTQAIGDLIHYCATRYFQGAIPLAEGLRRALADVEEKGWDILVPFERGDYARPRIFEVAAALNRMRTLRVKTVNSEK